jgi:hypothetical protein
VHPLGNFIAVGRMDGLVSFQREREREGERERERKGEGDKEGRRGRQTEAEREAGQAGRGKSWFGEFCVLCFVGVSERGVSQRLL